MAVNNYRRSLLAQGVPEGRALEMVKRYANRVHRRGGNYCTNGNNKGGKRWANVALAEEELKKG